MTSLPNRHWIQELFDLLAALISGLLLGVFLANLEFSTLNPSMHPGRTETAWSMLITISCYLGVWFWVNNMSRFAVWLRPRWVAISLGGTSLSFLIAYMRILWEAGRYIMGVGPFWGILFLFVYNVIMMIPMAAVVGMGFVVRHLAEWLCESKPVN